MTSEANQSFLTEALNRLLGRLKHVQPEKDGYTAECPAHGDSKSKSSLSITTTPDGKILLYCFAGCDTEQIMSAVGLTMADLFIGGKGKHGNSPVAPGIRSEWNGKPYVTHWMYRNASGDVIGYVVRYQKSPTEKKEVIPYFGRNGQKWKPEAPPKPGPLYGLDRLASRPDAPVVICEGEKSADAAGRLLPGYVAVSSQGGSGAAKKADWAPLKGRTVVVWPDNDQPGYKYARDVLVILKAQGNVGVKVIDPHALGLDNPKDDAADWPKGKPFPEQFPGYIEFDASSSPPAASGNDPTEDDEWATAREMFPRVEFPWEVFPDELSASLRQLAHSCATSPIALPGAAFAIIAAALGRAVTVSPKSGWMEPLVVWHGDIRASGDGKTPPARMLSTPLMARQKTEHDRYDSERLHYDGLPKKAREGLDPPRQPRGYFVTDLTLEGLRRELRGHLTGGLVSIQDELSGFVSAQNQYKSGKGNDREAWLALHDGHAARVVRKDESVYLDGARVSIFGGIQPGVFAKIFQQDDGLLLMDGTLFRFLLTFEESKHCALDATTWADNHRRTWEAIVARAMEWGDEVCAPIDGRPHRIMFSEEAQQAFFDWRNELDEAKRYLPAPIRGFIPKSAGYVARLAGLIHCIRRFDEGYEPQAIIGKDDLSRAIEATQFYLGQVVDALQLFADSEHAPDGPPDERKMILARVLDGLRGDVDNGRLAVGYVLERFNETASVGQQFKTPHAFGGFLRAQGLNVSNGKHDANGKRAVKCLLWNNEIENFLKQCLQCLHCLQTEQSSTIADADIKSAMSALSATPSDSPNYHADNTDIPNDEVQTYTDENGIEWETFTV